MHKTHRQKEIKMKKKIMLILIVLSFVFVSACATSHKVSITTPEGTYTYEETATTSMRPAK